MSASSRKHPHSLTVSPPPALSNSGPYAVPLRAAQPPGEVELRGFGAGLPDRRSGRIFTLSVPMFVPLSLS